MKRHTTGAQRISLGTIRMSVGGCCADVTKALWSERLNGPGPQIPQKNMAGTTRPPTRTMGPMMTIDIPNFTRMRVSLAL